MTFFLGKEFEKLRSSESDKTDRFKQILPIILVSSPVETVCIIPRSKVASRLTHVCAVYL